MDTISSLWEILKDINVNNISGVVVISFFIIIVFAGCMEPFFASNIEIMLMNRNDILKRTSLSYAILFIVFAMLNYIIAIETFFLPACIFGFIIFAVVLGIIKILSFFINKAKVIYEKYADYLKLGAIIIFFPAITYTISIIKEVNFISCSLLCALMELLIVALCFLNQEKRQSEVILQINNETWYVFRHIDNNLLCGNNRELKASTQIKLIDLEDISNKNGFFRVE